MRLFLCEKPSQAKDIGKVLGVLGGRHDGYFQNGDTIVTWAFGHILTQAAPDAYGEQYADFGNISALPILPEVWQMQVPPKVSKQFKVIKSLLAKADEVVIATDADREGEVIAREILDYCGYRKKISRFWTSGLDTQSVKKALSSIMPGKDKENLYQTGLARGRADWLVGMNLSRAYTAAYSAGYGREHILSIGRIQTPTLKLVVQRDKEIDTFVPYNYYTLSVDFETADKSVFTTLWQVPENWRNTDGYCTNLEAVKALVKQLEKSTGKVITSNKERKSTPPPLPYSLSALQKEAGKKLGLSASKVLKIAQTLYEKYKITSYPRTPCRYLPKSQMSEVKDVFAAIQTIDKSMLSVIEKADPERQSRVWNDNQVNKHSHHAIIPTKASNFDLSVLDKNELTVYRMIRDRYIAQFYPDFEYDSTVVEVEACSHLFKASNQSPVISGWKVLLGKDVFEGDQIDEGPALPHLKVNDEVDTLSFNPETKKTTPPPRFTEASLLDEMQTLKDFLKNVEDEQIRKILKSTEGLGTEATRATIIDRLFEMGYMEKKRSKIYATEKGRNLIARIPTMIADPITTAKWELALAGIEAGKLTLAEFMAYQQKVITELVGQAKKDAVGKARPPKQTDSAGTKKQAVARNEDDVCPTCKEGRLRQRGFKENPDKRYWGCSRFPECKHFEWVK
ncbi:DNA topoisomerase 3 [Neisseria gonorrhoeae]